MAQVADRYDPKTPRPKLSEHELQIRAEVIVHLRDDRRWGFDEIAAHFGISKQRVHQIYLRSKDR